MGNKEQKTLPMQGKVVRQDYVSDNAIIETAHREPIAPKEKEGEDDE